MHPEIAYLSDGKLLLKRDGQSTPELIESHFAQQMMDRAERSRQRTSWKTSGPGASFASMGLSGPLLWGGAGQRPDLRRVRITGVTRGPERGQLVYALDTDNVGGLFVYDAAEKHERRVFHNNDFRARDLCRRAKDGHVALAVQHPDGSANIAVMELTGRGIREVTEGDSIDEAPTWAPGDGKQVVFQSAGIGRDGNGALVALSTYAIQKVDLDNDKFETVLEDAQHDLLLPRYGEDGSLYFIRRPYKPLGHRDISPWRVALDVLLSPLRLIVAIVHFLNAFTMFFTKKPLLTAGGPPKEGADRRRLLLWGAWIDTQKALRESASGKGAGALVPANWELVRRSADGDEHVVARHVLSFDVCPYNGGVVFTNGTTIYHLPPGPDSQPTVVCKDRLVEHVAVVQH